VGCFYRDFTQTADAEVVALLDAARLGGTDDHADSHGP
jgi:predicted phosphoribosyltransferase